MLQNLANLETIWIGRFVAALTAPLGGPGMTTVIGGTIYQKATYS
jgi:hypothetical protein